MVTAAIDAEGSIPWASELYGVPIARGLGVRPALRGLIDFSEANAVQVWIVSASPEIVVRTAMKRFGLPGKLIALRNKTDDSVISMELDAPYSIGEGKVDCIRTFIAAGNRPLFGIGDSMHDLPMIEYADIHAVVDCGNALTQEARRRGWFILPSRARPLAHSRHREQTVCFRRDHRRRRCTPARVSQSCCPRCRRAFEALMRAGAARPPAKKQAGRIPGQVLAIGVLPPMEQSHRSRSSLYLT